jgi:threonyl-tRNA synthetase
LWLSPDQVAILPLSEKYQDYAENVLNILNKHDIRALVDDRAEKIGKKIRDAEVKKIPFMLIVGENEEASESVSARKHGSGDLGTLSIKDFISLFEKELEQ